MNSAKNTDMHDQISPSRQEWDSSIEHFNFENPTDFYQSKFDFPSDKVIALCGRTGITEINRQLHPLHIRSFDLNSINTKERSTVEIQNNNDINMPITPKFLLEILREIEEPSSTNNGIFKLKTKGEQASFHDFLRFNLYNHQSESQESAIKARKHYLQLIKTSLQEANIFFISFTATEHFIHKKTDFPLPCDIALHYFKPEAINKRFRHFQADVFNVCQDLSKTYETILAIRNQKPFYLIGAIDTDFPKEQYSNQNILITTNYLIATLRAALGHLAHNNEFIDYFPAFELATHPKLHSTGYSKNYRCASKSTQNNIANLFCSQLAKQNQNEDPSINAEDFFLKPGKIHIPADSDVFFDIPHGRLNHNILVTLNLFTLALKLQLNPKLMRIPSHAFPEGLANEFDRFYSQRLNFKPPQYLLRSEGKIHFTREFLELTASVEPTSQAKEILAKELTPIYQKICRPTNNLIQQLNIHDEEQFIEKSPVSLHLRRGDVGILFKKNYENSTIENLFKGDVLCLITANKFMPPSHHLRSRVNQWTWLSNAVFEDLVEKRITHAAIWFKRQKPISSYLKKISNKKLQDNLLVAFSNGFWQQANFLQRLCESMNAEEIHQVILDVEFKQLKQFGFHCFHGEPHPDIGFVDLLSCACSAETLICEESGFPINLVELLKIHSSTITPQ